MIVLLPLLSPPGLAGWPGPHAEQAALQPGPPPAAPMHRLPSPAPGVWVYGYLPYWADGLDGLPWDALTHVAWFSVGLQDDGSLSQVDRWQAIAPELVERASGHGVSVHLTLTCFDDDVMAAVLPEPGIRARTVEELADLVLEAGAGGVSVDCEGLPSSLAQDFVDFVAELAGAVPQVTVATPSVDWQGAYDYDRLAAAADALFIMGYGYHWSGGDPGPVSPLHGGGDWSRYALDWTVSDYLEWDAPADRLVLGLPLYGYDWPSESNDVPGRATGRGDALVYADAVASGREHGRLYDARTETPYTFPDERSQLWYDDADSLAAKIDFAMDSGLLGVGFWALNYDAGDAALWEMVAQRTAAAPSRSAGPVADAGPDRIARVGEQVHLQGSGEGDGPLSFRWSQEGGPPVVLRGAGRPDPCFAATEPGTVVLALAVTDRAATSQPDRVMVEVLGEGGGCASGPRHGAWWWGLLLLVYGQITRPSRARKARRPPSTTSTSHWP